MKRQTNYQKALDYLYTQLPMFQRVGQAAFKKDLTNILALAAKLNEPYRAYPTIHIAGTNGKGTTAHLLSAVLQASGYKVGLYTSPHYLDFRERIKVDGKLADKRFVVDFVKKNKSLFEAIKPSFFEITVAMAFQYFKEQNVDVAIIETGLGGRLDSTNIIQPILSIITNISLDHQQFLGDTLQSIAKEKAGIIKQNTPVVIGEYQAEIYPIFKDIAKKRQATLINASDIYETISSKPGQYGFGFYTIKENGLDRFIHLAVGVDGPFQSKNINTVFAALSILQDHFPKISNKTIQLGLRNVKKMANYQGRWQFLGENPKIIVDSAHNEAGLSLVMDALSKEHFNNLHIVLGMVNDKSHEKVLKFFPKTAKYYFAKANIPRGLEAKKLQAIAQLFDLKGKTYTSVRRAFAAAKKSAKEQDLIFVGGSIFVVAEVLD